ncbi:hypothetical protein EV694_0973 [Volucribacter psittacicida]|uniref:Uncharacterized protein n=1 Tax=Volucribacter psittacicida TaxID=203482 RepID=A0A4R1FUS8_9PAST|nr:hypothetical protein [Volucribacter psittacicida]TCJ98563.1 hypothetical protein EV694_0973 [Volucribacter psittacicida]
MRNKQYTYLIKAKVEPSDTSYIRYRVTASNIIEAKNKFKSLFTKAKIISCVKEEDKAGSSTLGKSVLGVASAATIALLAKTFSKK